MKLDREQKWGSKEDDGEILYKIGGGKRNEVKESRAQLVILTQRAVEGLTETNSLWFNASCINGWDLMRCKLKQLEKHSSNRPVNRRTFILLSSLERGNIYWVKIIKWLTLIFRLMSWTVKNCLMVFQRMNWLLFCLSLLSLPQTSSSAFLLSTKSEMQSILFHIVS